MFFFFFSSRRRHTRLQGDWSSDVCSSDLLEQLRLDEAAQPPLDAKLFLRLSNRPHQRHHARIHVELVVIEHESRDARSEEHTSELQSPCNLVCRLLLEKKKQ